MAISNRFCKYKILSSEIVLQQCHLLHFQFIDITSWAPLGPGTATGYGEAEELEPLRRTTAIGASPIHSHPSHPLKAKNSETDRNNKGVLGTSRKGINRSEVKEWGKLRDRQVARQKRVRAHAKEVNSGILQRSIKNFFAGRSFPERRPEMREAGNGNGG